MNRARRITAAGPAVWLAVAGHAAAATGAGFLRFTPSAWTVGMGGASAAAGSGPAALSGNPAGLLSAPGSVVALAHGTEIGGQRQEAAAFVTGSDALAAGGQVTLSTMSFDGEDAAGAPVGVSAQDLVASVAAARKFGSVVRAGATVRGWTSSLLGSRASGICADAGLRAVWDGRYAAGLVVRNAGTGERLGAGTAASPIAVVAGAAARRMFGSLAAALTAEWAGSAGGGAPHAGVEMSRGRFAVRAGYSGEIDAGRWSAGGSAGAGPFTIHYALAARGPFGPAHRLSAEWRWAPASSRD